MEKRKHLKILFAALMVALIALPAAWGEDTVSSLKERILDLQNKGALGFRNFALCSNIITYGQYVPYPDNKVKAGTKIYFYFEPENVFTNRLKGTYQMWFTQDMVVRTAKGEKLLDSPEAMNFNLQSLAPVLDLWANNSLNLGDLPPGQYEFVAVMHDKLKKADATQVFPFEVVP
jgi:hypothetical protein